MGMRTFKRWNLITPIVLARFANEPDGQGGTPKPLTAEDVAKLVEEKVSSLGTSLADQLAKMFAKREAEAQKKASDAEAKRKADEEAARAKAEEDAAAKKAEEDAKKGQQPSVDPKTAQLEAELARVKRDMEAQKKALEEKDRAATEAESKRRTVEIGAKLRESLQKAGIPGDRVGHAAGYLTDTAKRVRWDDATGQPVYVNVRDGVEDVLPLDEGISTFAKSPDAAIYLPPKETQGSKGTPGSGANGAGSGNRGAMSVFGEFLREQFGPPKS